MPYAAEANGQPGLPFSGVTPLSRVASHDGAVVAQVLSNEKRRAVYQWLVVNGPATDREIAEGCSMLLSAVCARRNELVQSGKVKAVGLKPGRFRARNTAWDVCA